MKGVVRRKVKVTAITTDEVEGVLRKLGLYDDVANGRAHCFICGRKIDLSNIGGILMVDEAPVLVCDKPSCIARAAILSREGAEAGKQL